MNDTTKPKKYKAFYGNYKYEGFLISEDDATYFLEDFKDGLIRLPKAGTLLKEVTE